MAQLLQNRYQILKILKQNESSTTYFAQDLQNVDHSQCVIKQFNLINSDPHFQAIAQDLLREEIEILQELETNNKIAKILNYFSENEQFYVVQEFIEGNPLNYELSSGQNWSEEKTYLFLKEALEILAFIHNKNVIHYKIKPSNLIRRKGDENLILTDFNLTKKLVGNKSKLIQQILPVNYPQNKISSYTPTQFITLNHSSFNINYQPKEAQESNPCFASDLYALGIIAIQALTGVKPQYLRRNIEGKIIWTDQVVVSEDFAHFLNKMVAVQAEDRYQNAQQALSFLSKISVSSSQINYSEFDDDYEDFFTKKETQTSKQLTNQKWLWLMRGGIGIASLILFSFGGFTFAYAHVNQKIKQAKTFQENNPQQCLATVNNLDLFNDNIPFFPENLNQETTQLQAQCYLNYAKILYQNGEIKAMENLLQEIPVNKSEYSWIIQEISQWQNEHQNNLDSIESAQNLINQKQFSQARSALKEVMILGESIYDYNNDSFDESTAYFTKLIKPQLEVIDHGLPFNVEIAKLKEDINILKKEKQDLQAKIKELEAINQQLTTENESKNTEIAGLTNGITQLEQHIKELENTLETQAKTIQEQATFKQ